MCKMQDVQDEQDVLVLEGPALSFLQPAATCITGTLGLHARMGDHCGGAWHLGKHPQASQRPLRTFPDSLIPADHQPTS